MRCRIVPDLPLVACRGQQAASLIDDDRAYRYVAVHRRQSGLIEGQPHRVVPLAQPAEFTHPRLLRRPYGSPG